MPSSWTSKQAAFGATAARLWLCRAASHTPIEEVVGRFDFRRYTGRKYRTIFCGLHSESFVDSVNQALVTPTNRAPKRDSKRRARRTREERSEEIRQNLIQAGARIVGRYGYEKASVARITAKAKVALGTFYRHFHSRQEFFDQLLPAMGDRLMAFIQSKVDPAVVGAEREEQRLRAYFEFLEEHPWYHRLLNESEVMAPKAHAVYLELMASGLVRSFQRSQKRGELKAFRESELRTLAYIVMASRVYLATQWGGYKGKNRTPPGDVLTTYTKFIQRALFD